MQNVMEDLIEKIWDLKEKHNLSKDNIVNMLKYFKQESAESGKYQKMRQNLKKLREKINQMELERDRRKKNMADNMRQLGSSYEDSSERVSVLVHSKNDPQSQKINDESDIQPEDDFMKKENATKYKSGRKYHSSDKQSSRALTQGQYNMDDGSNFEDQTMNPHPKSDHTDHHQNMNFNTNSRNSSHKVSNYFSMQQESKRMK